MQNERVGLCFHNLVLIMVVKAPGDREKEELDALGWSMLACGANVLFLILNCIC